MPQLPLWYRRLPQILAALEKPASPLVNRVVDRPEIETLFRVSRRQAIRLLGEAGGYKVGKTFVVERRTIVDFLRELETSGAGPEARARRRRVEGAVAEIANYAEAQRVRIDTPPETLRIKPSGLPSAIDLVAPGKLQITYTGAEDLLSRIVELAAAAANDFAGFRQLYEDQVNERKFCEGKT